MARNPVRKIGEASVGWARIVLRSRQHRRKTMFYLMLVAMAQTFCGAVVIDAFLLRRPLTFVAFWTVCLGLVAMGFLLAAYDLLVVRQEARMRERLLAQELHQKLESDADLGAASSGRDDGEAGEAGDGGDGGDDQRNGSG
ncbi:hypothetical protein BH23VER1_BH23VER1_22810 [soil metagenome]